MPEAAYSAAMEQHRPEMQKIYGDYFAEHEVDAILFPTTPLTARPIGDDETVELNGNQEPTFLHLFVTLIWAAYRGARDFVARWFG